VGARGIRGAGPAQAQIAGADAAVGADGGGGRKNATLRRDKNSDAACGTDPIGRSRNRALGETWAWCKPRTRFVAFRFGRKRPEVPGARGMDCALASRRAAPGCKTEGVEIGGDRRRVCVRVVAGRRFDGACRCLSPAGEPGDENDDLRWAKIAGACVNKYAVMPAGGKFSRRRSSAGRKRVSLLGWPRRALCRPSSLGGCEPLVAGKNPGSLESGAWCGPVGQGWTFAGRVRCFGTGLVAFEKMNGFCAGRRGGGRCSAGRLAGGRRRQ